MKGIRKYLALIKPIAYLFLVVFTTVVCLFIIELIINLIVGLINGDVSTIKHYLTENKDLIRIVCEITIIIVYSIWFRKLSKNEAKVKRKITLKNIGFLLIWSIGIYLLTIGLVNILFIFFEKYCPILIRSYEEEIISALKDRNELLAILSIVIIGPIIEELLCRGVLLKKASNLMPFFASNLLQSIIFSLLHMNVIQMIYTFPKGILYGYVNMRYGSIIPSIILHMAFNALGYGVSAIIARYDGPTGRSIWLIIILILVGTLLFYTCFNKMRCSTATEENIVKSEA